MIVDWESVLLTCWTSMTTVLRLVLLRPATASSVDAVTVVIV